MSITLELKTHRHRFEDRIPFQNKPLSPTPSPHNPINKIRIWEKCPHNCSGKQMFSSHWKYHYHIIFHHGNEPRNKELSLKLGLKIIQEIEK